MNATDDWDWLNWAIDCALKANRLSRASKEITCLCTTMALWALPFHRGGERRQWRNHLLRGA